jgi:hypothetical protein
LWLLAGKRKTRKKNLTARFARGRRGHEREEKKGREEECDRMGRG